MEILAINIFINKDTPFIPLVHMDIDRLDIEIGEETHSNSNASAHKDISDPVVSGVHSCREYGSNVPKAERLG